MTHDTEIQLKDKLKDVLDMQKFISTHGIFKLFPTSTEIIDETPKTLDKETFDLLHFHTRSNLDKLSIYLNIQWKYLIRYKHKSVSRTGKLFYGYDLNNNLFNYDRRETKSKQAGQTVMHIHTGRIQIHKLIKIFENRDVKLNKYDQKYLKIFYKLTNSPYVLKYFIQNI